MLFATTPYFLKRLNEELAARHEHNARYSMRSFARALKIQASALSEILKGKRVPSYKMSLKILAKLNWDPVEQKNFLHSVGEAQRLRGLQKLSRSFQKIENKNIKELSLDHFRILADWYHIAILELSLVKNFHTDSRWIAAQLGISPSEARLAVERLVETGLLHSDPQSGQLIKKDTDLLTASRHLTTPALRKRIRQILEKSVESLENDPIEERSHTGMTMAIDPEKIPAAKELIQKFNTEMSAFLESGSKQRVYELSVSLIPLQKNKEATLS